MFWCQSISAVLKGNWPIYFMGLGWNGRYFLQHFSRLSYVNSFQSETLIWMLVNESLKISKINTANKSVKSCRVPNRKKQRYAPIIAFGTFLQPRVLTRVLKWWVPGLTTFENGESHQILVSPNPKMMSPKFSNNKPLSESLIFHKSWVYSLFFMLFLSNVLVKHEKQTIYTCYYLKISIVCDNTDYTYYFLDIIICRDMCIFSALHATYIITGKFR